MAIDTPARHIYSGDGSTRVFPIPTYIQGDDYIRIEINGVHQVDRSKWDIVNNSIIFVIAPISESTIDVQVATSVEALAELGSITNIDIVADNIVDINTTANNIVNVNSFANTYKISSTTPSFPTEGMLWYDTVNNVVKYYDGSTWEVITADLTVINDTTIATNKAYSNQKTNELLSLKLDKDFSTFTDKDTPVDSDNLAIQESDGLFKKTSWANIKATIISSFGAMSSILTAKTTPVDADIFTIGDSTATNASKKLSWANIKATLKTYFDTLYTVASSETTSGIIELATTAEARSGTDDVRAITPLKLRNALNASGTAPIYACRAWVNFNGIGTVAIRASGNVSSITDNGTGDYTVNFTTAMPDVNYVLSGCVEEIIVSNAFHTTAPTTTSARMLTISPNVAVYDKSYIHVVVFR